VRQTETHIKAKRQFEQTAKQNEQFKEDEGTKRVREQGRNAQSQGAEAERRAKQRAEQNRAEQNRAKSRQPTNEQMTKGLVTNESQ